eukprot:13603780-Alexandrium_andersonii.AAC.1
MDERFAERIVAAGGNPSQPAPAEQGQEGLAVGGRAGGGGSSGSSSGGAGTAAGASAPASSALQTPI